MELHFIFDMICNPSYVTELVSKRKNLLLKDNLLSLKNMQQIYDRSLFNHLEHCVSLLTKHIQNCNVISYYEIIFNQFSCKKCQKKGHNCRICKSTQKIFPFDIQHTSFCRQCHGFYHLSCLELKGCPACVPPNLLTSSIISRSKRLSFMDSSEILRNSA